MGVCDVGDAHGAREGATGEVRERRRCSDHHGRSAPTQDPWHRVLLRGRVVSTLPSAALGVVSHVHGRTLTRLGVGSPLPTRLAVTSGAELLDPAVPA